DELESARDVPVQDREDVVLLVARSVDGTDLSDVAVELDARDQVAREPIVDTRPILELEGPPLLAHRRQLERRVQVEREATEVARQERFELELQVGLGVVRDLRLEIPAEVDGMFALVPERATRTESHPRVLDV